MTIESRLLDALGEALVAVDAELRVTCWNRSAERLFGWSSEEVCGQFVPRLVASSLVYESAFAVVRTVRSGQVWRGMLRLNDKNGNPIAVQSTVSSHYDEQGNVTGYVSIHRPHSAAAEEDSSIEKTGVLFQSCNDIVIVLDQAGRIVAWNPAAERTLKWKASEAMYHDYAEFIQAVSDLNTIFGNVQQRGSWRGEINVCDRHGEELTLDTDVTAVRDRNGKYLGVITISRDITISRRSELARRRSEARLRALLSVIPDTFLRVGRDGRIQDFVANGPFRVLLGAEPPLGKHIREIFPEVAQRLLAAIEVEGNERRVEHLTYHTKVGGQPSDLIFRVVSDATEEALIIVQDVTELYKMERELSESEERFRQLVEQKQVGVYLMQDMRFLYVNPRFAEICAAEREQLLQMSNLAIVVEADRALVTEHINRRLTGESIPPYTFRLQRLDGEVVDVEVYGALIQYRGSPAILGTVIDVTQRKRAEAALRESEERYRTVVGSLQEGVMLLGQDGQVQTCNESACRILGLSQEQLLGLAPVGPAWQIVREDGSGVAAPEHPAAITLRTGEPQSEVLIGLHKPTGEQHWLSMNSRPLFHEGDTEPYAVVVSMVDVTQRKHTQEDLQRRAFYDPLTGLPNRALFMDRVERALSQARRSEELVAVGFLDLDKFKALNDTHGHILGDLVLQQIALRLRRCLREGDTVARMGGDEFTLLLPNVSGSAEAARVAERLLDALRQPIRLQQGEFIITVSLGLSIFPHDGMDVTDLLGKADSALYRAKNAGKNTYQLFAGPAGASSTSGRTAAFNPSRPPGSRPARN